MNDPVFILGIDPGVSGAFALLDIRSTAILNHTALITAQNFPTKDKVGHHKRGRAIDPVQLTLTLEPYAKNISVVVIEAVGVMSGRESRSAMFNFGESFGVVKGVLSQWMLPVVYASPNKWKPALSLSRDKEESLNLARKLFPNQKTLFERKKDDGKAEAALLAYYGFKYLNI